MHEGAKTGESPNAVFVMYFNSTQKGNIEQTLAIKSIFILVENNMYLFVS